MPYKCLQCENGKLFGVGCQGFKPVEIDCPDCHGTGEITDEQAYWVQLGDHLWIWRVEQQLTARAAAQQAGVAMSAWFYAERGRTDPRPVLAKIGKFCNCIPDADFRSVVPAPAAEK